MIDGVEKALANENEVQGDSGSSFAKELSSTRRKWVAPELKSFGNLSFVVKGISYNPLDGISNLTP